MIFRSLTLHVKTRMADMIVLIIFAICSRTSAIFFLRTKNYMNFCNSYKSTNEQTIANQILPWAEMFTATEAFPQVPLAQPVIPRPQKPSTSNRLRLIFCTRWITCVRPFQRHARACAINAFASWSISTLAGCPQVHSSIYVGYESCKSIPNKCNQ